MFNPPTSPVEARNRPVEIGEQTASPQPSLNMGRSLGQIVLILVVVLVLVNIPANTYGFGLAHLLPQATPLVIHDGLLLKGSGPEIYLLEDHHLRRFSSPEAFEVFFRSDDVRAVEDSLLEQFEPGRPIHRLLRCSNSAYIYALERGLKRQVAGPAITNPAKAWDKVHRVSCAYLDRLPDGPPIAEDAETY